MESYDVVDDVNALIRLGVGDPYRLEHIKQAFIQNKTIWDTDKKYLKHMKEKYILKPRPRPQPDSQKTSSEMNIEDVDDFLHCWKCGKKNAIGANFCINCGSSLFDIDQTEQTKPEKSKKSTSQITSKFVGKKALILIGIPVLVLVIFGGAASQGMFSNFIDVSNNSVSVPKSTSTETLSKCGPGTVFDVETYSCILNTVSSTTGTVTTSTETLSKCGPGTIFNAELNTCELVK